MQVKTGSLPGAIHLGSEFELASDVAKFGHLYMHDAGLALATLG